MSQKVIVIGSGFAGLAAAASLAQKGCAVTLLEKNDQAGGRARTWNKDGYSFDMGPSFYWMPEVFDRFFARFGEKVSEHYRLVRLDPSYKIVFGKNESWKVPAGRKELRDFFESKEPGAGAMLDAFLAEAKVKYELGMGELVYRPSLSWSEYVHPGLIGGLLKTNVFRSLRRHVRSYFVHPHLRALMEFPVLFLGAAPQNTPALYSLMNYADLELGTWYPMGGMGKVIDGMVAVAKKQGVDLITGVEAKRIVVENGHVQGVETNAGFFQADVIVAGADYHHVEQHLLPAGSRDHTEAYWNERTMAPSSLLFYLGLDRKLPGLEHHTLFFDEALDQHSAEIYDDPKWPSKPLFYTNCTSKTDPGTAPVDGENLVILIPIATGLTDDDATREHYYALVMNRLQHQLGFDLREHVVVKRSYSLNDLTADYHAFRGNAYGLANTLKQTGPLRPKVKSRKVKGLYYTGQLTVPGPGVPPALISGQVVADLVIREMSRNTTNA